ncbi:hypothetical protein Ddc_11307 [Ditylenchus destructor]|nr:hypothetical protein Ddc_11307 [Ditylenchus destructor]
MPIGITHFNCFFAVLVIVQEFLPGKAQLIQDPTFAFSFYPPVSWTYHNNQLVPGRTDVIPVYPAQWANQADAQRKMEGDVKSAVINSMQKSGMSLSGLTVTSSGYTPENVPILDVRVFHRIYIFAIFLIQVDATTKPGSYKAELSAVVYQRTGTDGTTHTPYVKNMAIQVKTQFSASRTQWNNFANYLYNQLSISYKVGFTSLITFN